MYFIELVRLIICRLRGAVSIITLILLNLTISMTIFIFFASIMHNFNVYLENSFFSNIALREIVVMDGAMDFKIPIEADIFNDPSIETTIFMYETGISTIFLRENEIEVGAGWYLSVVEIKSIRNTNDFIDMYDINGQPLNGIFISLSAMGYNEPLALVGEEVEFVFDGIIHTFPIIGIIPIDAAFFLGREAGHYMYIHSQLLNENWDYAHSARLILSDVDQLNEFVKRHYFDDYILIFDEKNIRHTARIKSAVGTIFLLSNAIFLLLTTICLVNGLRYLQHFNHKKNSLLRILGFSKRELVIINMIEGLMIGCLGVIGGLVLSFFLKAILAQTTFVVENNISELFNVGSGVALVAVFTSNFVVLVAKIIVSIQSTKTDHLQVMSF